MKIKLDNNDPYICCKICERKLELFELIYYQGEYCLQCAKEVNGK
jgi:hypothetical protein